MKNISNKIYYYIVSKIRAILGQSHRTKQMSYGEYLALQRKKTEDLERRTLWLGSEYELKIMHFRKYFEAILPKLINFDQSVLCVAARTGQEVAAIKELGYLNSIGIDLVPCEPYVIFGDMHDLPFSSASYALVFSNSFDHSLDPLKFLEEVHRVLKPEGIFILHVLFNRPNDSFGVTNIYSPKAFRKLFKGFSIVQEGKIELFSLNYQYILKKIHSA
jgi:SAM-dependent methyltransferase